jgi:hypothetical protein
VHNQRGLFGKRNGKRPLEKHRIILKWILKTKDGGEKGIVLAQDKEKSREPLNTVISPRVP